ncbi:WD40-repeat-containing domain [Pseudocohnilembus persalinus]|uniref:WD40-repeat-containing domain n=1 Tax=Pseudocohnilembus persalinus TaxID=266149 RepID=A0A0V0QA60_PSEPJ|nr:WD40-repeat-containing domain [Pseudocohnilembus persalinus]|eukprot:KRW98951.1 WD40-repeat-containing domain [Pseudocohnilembus persalinus]
MSEEKNQTTNNNSAQESQISQQQKIEEEIILNKNIPEICHDSLYNTQKLFFSNQKYKVNDFQFNTYLKLKVKINSEYKIQNGEDIQQNQNRYQNGSEGPEKSEKEKIHEEAEKIAEMIAKQSTQVQDPRLQMQMMRQQQKKQGTNQKEKQIDDIISDLSQEQKDKLSKIPTQFLQYQKQSKQFQQTQQQLLAIKEDETKNRMMSEIQDDGTNDNKSNQIAIVDKANMGRAMVGKIKKIVKPDWHRPWKLYRVVAGHQGWIRCLAMDPGNQFIVTGSTDRTIKLWDMASGQLKLTLTGHISAVRGVLVSDRHPYLFSCGEDKAVKCWDLETNQIIRNYHGHLSGVYCMSMHPTLNVLATGGRDASVRIWDIRMKTQVHVLGGHENTVNAVTMQNEEPQCVSGGSDNMVKLWDLRQGTSFKTLTNHKKGVRALVFHPKEYTFASGAADNIKVWKCPEGEFLRNVSGHNSIINTLALNNDNVLVSGADNGSLKFWDWKSGYNFQTIESKPQPGSIAAENGIFASTFDMSQTRFITGECDKTLKFYKEDDQATEETHPIQDFKIEYDHQF